MIEAMKNMAKYRAKAKAAIDETIPPESSVPDRLLTKPTAAHLTEEQLGERLGMGISTIRRKRLTGDCPPFIRAAKKPLYPVKALLKWEDDNVNFSTTTF